MIVASLSASGHKNIVVADDDRYPIILVSSCLLHKIEHTIEIKVQNHYIMIKVMIANTCTQHTIHSNHKVTNITLITVPYF